MKRILFFSLVIAISATGCREIMGKQIRGNGNVTTEQRTVTGFTGVETRGSIDISVTQGDFKVSVESDQNILPYIITEVENGRLVVRFKEDEYRGFNYSTAKVHVTAPLLDAFLVNGSGNIAGTGKLNAGNKMDVSVSGSGDIKLEINSPSVNTEISGSGNITLAGETKDLSASTNGSGDTRAYDLQTETAKITVHGSGNTEISASVKIDAEVYGSGDINYKGKPQISSESHGSGSIRQVN